MGWVFGSTGLAGSGFRFRVRGFRVQGWSLVSGLVDLDEAPVRQSQSKSWRVLCVLSVPSADLRVSGLRFRGLGFRV